MEGGGRVVSGLEQLFGFTTGSLGYAERNVDAVFGTNLGDLNNTTTIHPEGWKYAMLEVEPATIMKGVGERRCIWAFDVG